MNIMRQFFKIILLYTTVTTITMGQYHQVTESSVQSEVDTQKDQSQQQATNSGVSNDTKQCPTSADTMYQTTGPVNIYLHGGYASTDKDTQSSQSKECNCPPGPAGPKGDPGPRGPPGPTVAPAGNATYPFAAFFAKMELQYGPYNEYRRVVFDHVITNIGNAYNHYKGVFTAPVNGVYQFHVHIHTIVKHKAEVKLRIGRVDVVSAWADSESITGENHEMGSSNSLIVHLRQGQMVFCVLPKQQALAGLGFTSFSGHLLRTNDQIEYRAPVPTQDIYNTDDLMGIV